MVNRRDTRPATKADQKIAQLATNERITATQHRLCRKMGAITVLILDKFDSCTARMETIRRESLAWQARLRAPWSDDLAA